MLATQQHSTLQQVVCAFDDRTAAEVDQVMESPLSERKIYPGDLAGAIEMLPPAQSHDTPNYGGGTRANPTELAAMEARLNHFQLLKKERVSLLKKQVEYRGRVAQCSKSDRTGQQWQQLYGAGR